MQLNNGEKNFKKQPKINHIQPSLKAQSSSVLYFGSALSNGALIENYGRQKKMHQKKHCRIKTAQVPLSQISKSTTLNDNLPHTNTGKNKNKSNAKSQEKGYPLKNKKIIQLNCHSNQWRDGEKVTRMQKTTSLRHIGASGMKNLVCNQKNIKNPKNSAFNQSQKDRNIASVQSLHRGFYNNYQQVKNLQDTIGSLNPQSTCEQQKKVSDDLRCLMIDSEAGQPVHPLQQYQSLNNKLIQIIHRVKQSNRQWKQQQSKLYAKRQKKILQKMTEMQQKNKKMCILFNQVKKRGVNIDEIWMQVFKQKTDLMSTQHSG